MAYPYEYPYTDPNRHNDDWAIGKIKDLLSRVEALEGWEQTHQDAYNELKKLYDDIIAGRFPASIERAFHDWMLAHANELVGEMVKNVFFGLSDSGYFVAYIPESWDDITFNTTGLDINVELMPEYGHLVLSY